MKDNYDDIINLPHFVSKDRKHMSNHDRAAQFAPFAALTGYDDSIKEAARIVDEKIELGEQEIQELDYRFHIIETNIKDKPKVNITYFVKDKNKNGGTYFTKEITIRKIDMIDRIIITIDKEKYNLDDIYSIEGEIFEKDNFY